MVSSFAVLLLATTALASPWVASPPVKRDSSTNTQQVFYGRFISAPGPEDLSIKTGAVLVSTSDGRGVIEKTVWNVTDVNAATAQLGVGADVPVIQSADDGFFFPGFIGKCHLLYWRVNYVLTSDL